MLKNIQDTSFKLLNWFGWLSLFVIIGIAVAQALLLSNFLTSHIFQREGQLSRDFVQNILVADGSLDYLSNPSDPALAARFRNTLDHIKEMHDLLRANIYKTDGTVLWSTNSEMIGRRFPGENDELEDALKGELVINPAHISEWVMEKKEHIGINPAVEYFVECYIPVIQPKTGKVIGVVEFYRAPVALTNAIKDGRNQVWMEAFASVLALFGSLFWIVHRADKVIKRQHLRLIETETLALLGELASSIAHNIRNPLSSIRSAAEVALESPKDDCSEQANDIIHEVDRIGRQISELLNFSNEDSKGSTSVDLKSSLERCVSHHLQSFERRQLTLEFYCSANNTLVLADDTLLQQVFHSILSNAAEAMDGKGRCFVKLINEDNHSVSVEISDTGSGISPEVKSKVFRPFFTTKPKGLGLGLSLAHKIIERFNGKIEFRDNDEKGTIVKITLPTK
jgi:two-component system sensor histidine kinase HydH